MIAIHEHTRYSIFSFPLYTSLHIFTLPNFPAFSMTFTVWPGGRCGPERSRGLCGGGRDPGPGRALQRGGGDGPPAAAGRGGDGGTRGDLRGQRRHPVQWRLWGDKNWGTMGDLGSEGYRLWNCRMYWMLLGLVCFMNVFLGGWASCWILSWLARVRLELDHVRKMLEVILGPIWGNLNCQSEWCCNCSAFFSLVVIISNLRPSRKQT